MALMEVSCHLMKIKHDHDIQCSRGCGTKISLSKREFFFLTVVSDYARTNLINYRQFVRQNPRLVAKENFIHLEEKYAIKVQKKLTFGALSNAK